MYGDAGLAAPRFAKVPKVPHVVPDSEAVARCSRRVAMPEPASVPLVNVMLTERPTAYPLA